MSLTCGKALPTHTRYSDARLALLAQPTLIPPNETIEGIRMIEGHDEDELEWILIVEKDVSSQAHLYQLRMADKPPCLATMRRLSFRPFARPNSGPSTASS